MRRSGRSANALSDRRLTEPLTRLSSVPVPSWQRKYDRAEEHFHLFLAELKEHSTRYPYGIRVQRNPDPRVVTLHLSIEKFPDLNRWSLVLGDCIHNLRSTLDHLIYRAAINVAKSDPPPDEKILAYPIRPKDFRHLGLLRQNGPFMAVFNGLQPDMRPEWKGLQPLPVLEELDNFDKHRTLNVMYAQSTSVVYGFSTIAEPSRNVAVSCFPYFGPLEPDTELARCEAAEPIPDVKVEWRQTVAPTISHSPGSDGRNSSGAIDLIKALSAEVEFVIAALFPFL